MSARAEDTKVLHKSKKWIIGETDETKVTHISKKFGISRLAARLILLRGINDDEQVHRYLLKGNTELTDPFLLPDMEKAVNYIRCAAENGTKITVYGDYDVDGITSTYILCDYLKTLGADVGYYIPDRAAEGYGMNTAALQALYDDGTRLIITVDVGITAMEEVRFAKSLGIDVIVTDHHTPKETVPDCTAVINPKLDCEYPFDSLAGVGVAFCLVYALSGKDESVAEKYCGIAALGTVADMVPLQNENRVIVSRGLEKLNKRDNIGINALLQAAGAADREITSTTVGFTLAPRLNAAGRIASAAQSVQLLFEKDPTAAMQIAERLNSDNNFRRSEENRILSEAINIINKNEYYNDDVIVVAAKGWHHGVIGIVSSRLTELYYKPSAVISVDDNGTGKASGRSIAGFNLFDALSACADCLVKFGGHELAAGFSLIEDEIDNFRNKINEYAKNIITDEIATPKLSIDAAVSAADVNEKTVKELEILEPCGMGNRSPMFCINDAAVGGIRHARTGNHMFVTLCRDGASAEAPAFNMADALAGLAVGDRISVAGALGVNEYRGVTTAQFIIRDIRQSKKTPLGRDALAKIFESLKFIVDSGKDKCSLSALGEKFGGNETAKAALMIFDELDIINCTFCGADSAEIRTGKNYKAKNNLENSETYRQYNGKEG